MDTSVTWQTGDIPLLEKRVADVGSAATFSYTTVGGEAVELVPGYAKYLLQYLRTQLEVS